MRYKGEGGWYLMWGQFKAPYLREELLSVSVQLAADRSLTSRIFSPIFVQGVKLGQQLDD